MFLEKYLNSTYLDLVYDNYDEKYLNCLDEDNFQKVYLLLKSYNFYFIEDIILNDLELFEIEVKYVQQAISHIKFQLGDDFANLIGQNMTLIDQMIDLAMSYRMMENI